MSVTWREGTRGKMRSRFLALRVRPANIELRRTATKAGRGAPGPLAALRVALRSRASRSSTGSPTSPTTLHCTDSCGWRRCAGGSSTTTASSKTHSGSITSKAAATPAGITTSPSSRSPTRSSPWSDAGARERGRQPDPVRGRAGAQALLACWHGTCPTCRRRAAARSPTSAYHPDLTEHYSAG